MLSYIMLFINESCNIITLVLLISLFTLQIYLKNFRSNTGHHLLFQVFVDILKDSRGRGRGKEFYMLFYGFLC
jgi:hypothetical protein